MRGFIVFFIILTGYLYPFDAEKYDSEYDIRYYENFEINMISKEIILYHKIQYRDVVGVWLKKPVYKNDVFEIENVFLKDRFKDNVKAFFLDGNLVKMISYNQENREVKEYEMEYSKGNKVSSITQYRGGFLFDAINRMNIIYNDDESKIRRIDYLNNESVLKYVDFYFYFGNEIKVVRIDNVFDVLDISIYRVSNSKIELKKKSYEKEKYNYYGNASKIIAMRYDDMIDSSSTKEFVNYGENQYHSVDLNPGNGAKKVISFYDDGFLVERTFLNHEAPSNDPDFIRRSNYIYDGAWDGYDKYTYTKGLLNMYVFIQVRNGWIENNQFHYYDEILNEKWVAEKKYQHYPNGRLFSEALYVNDKRDSVKTYNVLDDYRLE